MVYINHTIIEGCKNKFNLQDDHIIWDAIRFIDSFLVKDNIDILVGEFIYDCDDVFTRNILLYLLKAMYHKDLVAPYHEELEKEIMKLDYVNE